MNFAESVAALLARAYHVCGAGPLSVNFTTLGAELGMNRELVVEATRVLERRGLIACHRDTGRTCRGNITGEGRILVEGDSGTGPMRRYRESPPSFLVVLNSPGANLNTGVSVAQTSKGASAAQDEGTASVEDCLDESK